MSRCVMPLIVVLLFATAVAHANPLGLMLTRLHEPVYAPGVPVEIMVTIGAASQEGIKAMGLYETLPYGWRFESVNAGDGQLPAVMPAAGAGPQLEFAWITPPTLPCSFSYTVIPPDNAYGVKEIHGVLEYRMQEGPYPLPDVITAIIGPEEQKPTLTLRGDQVMEVLQGSEWEEPGYTALDANMQDISGRVIVSGEVFTDQPGTFTIRYSVASESGKQVTAVERIVKVVTPETATAPLPDKPNISRPGLSGAAPVPDAIVKPEAIADTKESIEIKEEQQKSKTIKKGRLFFPDLSAYRPVVPESQENEGDNIRTETEEEIEPEESMEGENENRSFSLLENKRRAASSESATSDGNVRQHTLKKQESTETVYWKYMMAGATGVAVLGLIFGAWFVYISGNKKKHHHNIT